MFKIPTKLRVFGHTYSVTIGELDGEGANIYGICLHREKKIILSNKNTYSQNEATLLHEVIHVISDSFAAGLEEKQVQAIASGLYSVLKDNEKLLKT